MFVKKTIKKAIFVSFIAFIKEKPNCRLLHPFKDFRDCSSQYECCSDLQPILLAKTLIKQHQCLIKETNKFNPKQKKKTSSYIKNDVFLKQIIFSSVDTVL
jgi:hypothetical protein